VARPGPGVVRAANAEPATTACVELNVTLLDGPCQWRSPCVMVLLMRRAWADVTDCSQASISSMSTTLGDEQ